MFSAIPNKPHQTAVVLDFLVIGGSSAGLSAAYALRRVGHRVLVLEQNADFSDVRRLFIHFHPPVGSDLPCGPGTSVRRIQDTAQHVESLLSLGSGGAPPQARHQVQHDYFHSL